MEQPVTTHQEIAHLQEMLSHYASLLDLTGRLSACTNVMHALPAVLESAQETGGVDALRITIEDQGEMLSLGAGYHANHLAPLDQDVAALVPPGSPVTGVYGAASELLSVPHDTQINWLAAWPLRTGLDHYGCLWAGNVSAAELPDVDRDFLGKLAAQIALTISRERAIRNAAPEQTPLAAILDSIGIPVIAIARDGRVLALAQAAGELLQLDVARVIGQPVQAVLKERPELLRLFRNQGRFAQDDEWQSQDGRTFNPHVSVFCSATGEPAGLVLTLHDATTLKALNRSQQQYIELVTHDVRSPLTFMQGYADLIGKVGTINDEQAFFIEKILNGVQQITALVDNIQDAGRWDPETGIYDMNREPVDLTRTVQTIISNHQELARKNNLSLITEIAADVPVVNVDNVMIERALINLVTNAIKYSPDGGEVRVSMEVRERALVICVSDTGIGIAPEHHDQIFNRGARVVTKEISKRKIKGSGLGLFIVRSVARRHGGDVSVESEPGQGSRFFFTIPLEGANLLGGA